MTPTRPSLSASPAVIQVPLSDEARALATLAQAGYTDAFIVTCDVGLTAEQWVQAVLGDAPLQVRRGLFLGWLALGLRLGSPCAPDRVLGWRLRHRDPAYVLLGAESWIGLPAQLLFRAEPRGLLFATFVAHTNPAARVLWGRITSRHQRIVGSLLAHAARRQEAPGRRQDSLDNEEV